MVSVPLQGSVDQLREVWEATDGLDPQEFNPKTFFKLHGEAQLMVLLDLGSALCLLFLPMRSVVPLGFF